MFAAIHKGRIEAVHSKSIAKVFVTLNEQGGVILENFKL
jgi:hypothetical protein